LSYSAVGHTQEYQGALSAEGGDFWGQGVPSPENFLHFFISVLVHACMNFRLFGIFYHKCFAEEIDSWLTKKNSNTFGGCFNTQSTP